MKKQICQRSKIALFGVAAIAFALMVPDIASAQQKKKADPSEQAVLLGQFGDWGAYTATPGGKKVCFALAKPTKAATDPAGRNRDASYAFISTRPAE